MIKGPQRYSLRIEVNIVQKYNEIGEITIVRLILRMKFYCNAFAS